MIKRWTSLFPLLLMIVGLLSHVSFALDQDTDQTRHAKNPIKIGVVLALSGPATLHGNAILHGLQLAKEDLLKQGISIDLLIEDDQTNAPKTIAAFRKISAQGYSLIIGPTWSFQVSSILPMISKLNVLMVAPVSSSDINGGSNPMVFNMATPRSKTKKAALQFLKQNKVTSLAVLTPNGDWGEIHRVIVMDAAKELGATIVADERIDYGSDVGQVSSILSRALVAKPQALFVTSAPADVATLIKARQQLKSEIPVLSTGDLCDALKGKLIDTTNLVPRDAAFEFFPPREFIERVEARFPQAPSRYSDLGYDSLTTLVDAIRHTDGSPKAVAQYFKSSQGFLTLNGKITFNEKGDVNEGEFLLVPAMSGCR